MKKTHNIIIASIIVALVYAASFSSMTAKAKNDRVSRARAAATAPGLAISTSCGPVAFSPATNFAVGSGPQSVAVGDFNGDGKQDLVAANNPSNNVSVLLGDGAGGFGVATNYSAGLAPQAVAVGDFNGDGKQDLAVADSIPNIAILLGDGTGGFGAATNFSLGFVYASSIVVGDFNGDGKQDLATADNTQDRVSVLLGDGAGGFGPVTHFFVGNDQEPISIAAGDMNGDGKLDLVTADLNLSNVTVLLGDGTGNFSIATYSEGAITNPYSLVLGDFNGDGKLDVATADTNTSNVAVLLGDGTGALSAPTFTSVPGFPFTVTASDFDGDGKLDLATGNAGSNDVSILLGNGAGNFGAPVNFGAGAFPFSIALGDFNGDGQRDLVTANNSSNDVSVLLRQCSQTNQPPVAKAKNISVSADVSGQASITPQQVDNGSFDPDSGDTITLSLDNAGPFSFGAHQVTLTATDNHGASSSAPATVTVVDTTPPAISCPASLTVDATKAAGAVVIYQAPSASDASPFSVSCSPVSGSTFSMGTTAVTCVATDSYHNSNSCTFSVTVRAPRKIKQDVLAQVVALRATTTNRRDREELGDVIEELTESLDSRLWLDDSHVQPGTGERAFNEEQDAVSELRELIRNRQSTIPDAVLQSAITRLVQADRVLASVAIKDAVARGGDARIIARANAAVLDGDGDAVAGKPNEAIADYREAWARALRA